MHTFAVIVIVCLLIYFVVGSFFEVFVEPGVEDAAYFERLNAGIDIIAKEFTLISRGKDFAEFSVYGVTWVYTMSVPDPQMYVISRREERNTQEIYTSVDITQILEFLRASGSRTA